MTTSQLHYRTLRFSEEGEGGDDGVATGGAEARHNLRKQLEFPDREGSLRNAGLDPRHLLLSLDRFHHLKSAVNVLRYPS